MDSVTNTRLLDIASANSAWVDRLTQLTYDAFKQHAPEWLPTLADAQQQVLKAQALPRIGRVLVRHDDTPLGWIGAIPQSRGRIWEIHPLVVAVTEQGKGYGQTLVAEIETLAKHAGVLGLVAGTSDQTGATSLYGVDLYADPLGALVNLHANHPHPYQFWVKMGFVIVGVMPDIDGPGKPGISLAKRLVPA
jgi:aminoglycoside 6'-N-acetyltransferase I